ncbi:MAG: caspase family protein [Candidatus Fermentibacteraceae bacterium]|nr:caspase family protein [Candidatus Fermentibacteraceae bacterium]
MLSAILFTGILAVTLPDPSDIQTITADESAVIDLSSGEGWIRLLEDDYVCLSLSVSGGVNLTAYDNSGSILCQSDSEGEMVLSAFSGYWFYIFLERDTGIGDPDVTLSVEIVEPVRLIIRNDVSGRVTRNEMAEIYTFSPEERGSWTFRLEGTGGTDLDLEIYSRNMSLWGSSASLEGFETVTVPALPGEELTAVVSRYGKSGSGEYYFSVEPSGRFPEFDSDMMETSIEPGEIHRYLIPEHSEPVFLDLTILSPGADIDLTVRDTTGEYLMGSQSYSSIEALMLPATEAEVVVDVILFESPDNESVPYVVNSRELESVSSLLPMENIVSIGVAERTRPLGFSPHESGIFKVSVIFDKSRDGDVRVFRGSGEPALTFTTERGDEEFLLWISQDDTVWVYPFFQGIDRSGNATVRISAADSREIGGTYHGEIGEDSSTEFFTVAAHAGTILDISLSGEDREVDLDLFVSGPGIDLVAEGWLSNVDAAGDEAVAVYSDEDAEYGITVYLYERRGRTSFSLDVNRIEQVEIASPSPESEIWAITAGISGYPAAEDVLNRASMDAVEVYDFLIEEQGIPEDHVILLVDAIATVDNFIDGVSNLLENAGPEDRVVIFFSGHGNQLAPGSGGQEESDSANESICFYDDEVSDDRLAALVDSLADAAVFLFFDACHSGGFVNDFDSESNVLVLTAAREDLSVSERILTPILLQGSRGDADIDGNGYVSALELMTYIDGRLQLICPECDTELAPNTYVCPECGAALKGENAVPRPQQGMFLDEDVDLWKTSR